MRPLTVFLVGEISTGKSALLNALSGNIISNTSLQRETFNPEGYLFSDKGSDDHAKMLTKKLEETHKNNELKRNNINTLKQEDIAKIISKNYTESYLKTKYGLHDFNIIDFPGIDDSDDTNNNFFQAIKDNIHLCDIIVYIVDATRAFVSNSGVANFNKILELIKNEKNNGHFVDYVVVANKFDNVNNEDLNAIYNRIPEKINIPKEKLFKCSSHKLLIDCQKRHKTNLSVPLFMKNEIIEIFKNSNLVITKRLERNVKKKAIINYSDIQYSNLTDDLFESQIDDDSDDYSSDTSISDNVSPLDDNDTDTKLLGDWDDIIGYLKKYQQEADKYNIVVLVEKLEELLVIIQKASDNKSYGAYSGTFITYIAQLKVYGHQTESILLIFKKYVLDLGKTNNESFLWTLYYKFIQEYDGLYQVYIANRHKLCTKLLSCIIYSHRHENINKLLVPLVEILSDGDIWKEYEYQFYNINDKKYYKSYNLSPGIFKHKSWFINNMLNNSNKIIQQLIEICITPINELSYLYDNIHWLLQKIHPDLPLQLKYYINTLDDHEILQYRMFSVTPKTIKAIEQYKRFGGVPVIDQKDVKDIDWDLYKTQLGDIKTKTKLFAIKLKTIDNKKWYDTYKISKRIQKCEDYNNMHCEHGTKEWHSWKLKLFAFCDKNGLPKLDDAIVGSSILYNWLDLQKSRIGETTMKSATFTPSRHNYSTYDDLISNHVVKSYLGRTFLNY
jgi:GTPase Era involved in 16S rRNA processing